MTTITQRADHEARVSLPLSFADSTVLIEQISDMEVRIRKIQATSEEAIRFTEESRSPLSDRDRDLFLALLDNPPPASETLKRAVRKCRGNQFQG